MNNELENRWHSLLGETGGVLKQAAEYLLIAKDGIPTVNEVALEYVRQQANSVASVALDVQLLVSQQRFQNVAGLCRIGFESRISMYAAMRVPEFAAQKRLAGAEAHVRELEALIKSGVKSYVFQKELEKHSELLNQMRTDLNGVQARKWWPFSEVAKAAGLMADYEEHYSLLSKAAHNTPTGLAFKDDPRILVSTVLRLLHDTVEACTCLVFFRQGNNTSSQPVTIKWKEIIEPTLTLQSEYGKLAARLNEQLREEFGEQI